MRWKKTLAALVAISISGLAYAESVTPRTPYVTGQPITASEINTDFDNIHTAVNDNNTRIGTNISSINTITFTTIPGVSASIPTSINDLSDVNTADAANGKILKYSSGTLIVADDDVVNNLNGLSDVDTTGLTTNSVLKYNGSDTWVIGTDDVVNDLNGLSDVDTTGLTTNSVLKYNGSDTWVIGTDDVVNDLNGLSDVDTTGLTTNSVLKYNGSDTWVIGTDNDTNVTSIFGLTDVINTGNADGKVLKWDNGNSRFAPADDVGAVTITDLDNVGYPGSVAPTNGQVLKWNGSIWAPGNDAGGVGSDTIAGMTDTNVSSPAAGESLLYNNTTGSWENIKTDTAKRTHFAEGGGSLAASTHATASVYTTLTNTRRHKVVFKRLDQFDSTPFQRIGVEVSHDGTNWITSGLYYSFNTMTAGQNVGPFAGNNTTNVSIQTEGSGASIYGVKELTFDISQPDGSFPAYIKVDGVIERGADKLARVYGYIQTTGVGFPAGNIKAIRLSFGNSAPTNPDLDAIRGNWEAITYAYDGL